MTRSIIAIVCVCRASSIVVCNCSSAIVIIATIIIVVVRWAIETTIISSVKTTVKWATPTVANPKTITVIPKTVSITVIASVAKRSCEPRIIKTRIVIIYRNACSIIAPRTITTIINTFGFYINILFSSISICRRIRFDIRENCILLRNATVLFRFFSKQSCVITIGRRFLLLLRLNIFFVINSAIRVAINAVIVVT